MRLGKIGDDIAMGEHGAFGDARRATGVLQEGEVFMSGFRRLPRNDCPGAARRGTDRARDPPRRHHALYVFHKEINGEALQRRQHVADLRRYNMFDQGIGDDLVQRVGAVLQDDDGLGSGSFNWYSNSRGV